MACGSRRLALGCPSPCLFCTVMLLVAPTLALLATLNARSILMHVIRLLILAPPPVHCMPSNALCCPPSSSRLLAFRHCISLRYICRQLAWSELHAATVAQTRVGARKVGRGFLAGRSGPLRAAEAFRQLRLVARRVELRVRELARSYAQGAHGHSRRVLRRGRASGLCEGDVEIACHVHRADLEILLCMPRNSQALLCHICICVRCVVHGYTIIHVTCGRSLLFGY